MNEPAYTPEQLEELAIITATDNGPHHGDPAEQPTPEDVAAMLARFE